MLLGIKRKASGTQTDTAYQFQVLGKDGQETLEPGAACNLKTENMA